MVAHPILPALRNHARQFLLRDVGARQRVFHAASLIDGGEPSLKEASMARLVASEAAGIACPGAIQAHGGCGHLEEFGVAKIYRDVRACHIYEGTSDIQRMVIARLARSHRMSTDPVVIAGYARTPIGGFQGAFAGLAATTLGAASVKAAVERATVPKDAIERIYMGCVLPAGLGQAPARQAGFGAGLPESVEATTVNKMCGSGMQAAILAAEALAAGAIEVAVAGGMESMTNAPYLLAKHRSGARIGHDVVKDSMYLDGLEDAYTPGKLMGAFAEDTARSYQFGREMQDAFALRSLQRAQEAIASGAFADEIVPVTVSGRGGDTVVDTDEQPGKGRPDKIPTLKPAFAPDGTITAASSASISDGAAALVLTRGSVARRLGLPAVATVVATAAHAHAPGLFTTAPVQAMRKVLARAGWSAGDVDLFEVNEAFAVVAMIAARDLDIPDDRLNVNGGATALGHPIGASGARIIATLIAALQRRGKRRGVASLCIGGGEATAVALELI